MPLINGRYYANPAYGRALEQARAEDADGLLGDEDGEAEGQARRGAPHQLGVDEVTRVVHNEGAGGRASARQGPGSPEDLSQARQAMAGVILNEQAGGHLEQMAPSWLSPSEAEAVQKSPVARAHFEDARRAAEQAFRIGGDPRGPKHFYHVPEDWSPSDPRRPDWARGTPVHRFGPFLNTAGGKVPRGARFYVEIHP